MTMKFTVMNNRTTIMNLEIRDLIQETYTSIEPGEYMVIELMIPLQGNLVFKTWDNNTGYLSYV